MAYEPKSDEFWNQKDLKKQDEIRFAQSWNLAVAFVGPSFNTDKDHDVARLYPEIIQTFKVWQVWFYAELKNRPAIKPSETKPNGKTVLKSKAEIKDITIDEAEQDNGTNWEEAS